MARKGFGRTSGQLAGVAWRPGGEICGPQIKLSERSEELRTLLAEHAPIGSLEAQIQSDKLIYIIIQLYSRAFARAKVRAKRHDTFANGLWIFEFGAACARAELKFAVRSRTSKCSVCFDMRAHTHARGQEIEPIRAHTMANPTLWPAAHWRWPLRPAAS